MLPACDQDEVALLPGHQQAASPVHYTTSCKHSLALLRMGGIIARNMLSWLKSLIKLLLLHLVGCLYYWCILVSFTVFMQENVRADKWLVFVATGTQNTRRRAGRSLCIEVGTCWQILTGTDRRWRQFVQQPHCCHVRTVGRVDAMQLVGTFFQIFLADTSERPSVDWKEGEGLYKMGNRKSMRKKRTGVNDHADRSGWGMSGERERESGQCSRSCIPVRGTRPPHISHTKSGDICSMAAINALYADIYMAVVPVGHNVFLAAVPSSAATGAVRWLTNTSMALAAGPLTTDLLFTSSAVRSSVCLGFETTFELTLLQNYLSLCTRENRTKHVGVNTLFGQNTEFS